MGVISHSWTGLSLPASVALTIVQSGSTQTGLKKSIIKSKTMKQNLLFEIFTGVNNAAILTLFLKAPQERFTAPRILNILTASGMKPIKSKNLTRDAVYRSLRKLRKEELIIVKVTSNWFTEYRLNTDNTLIKPLTAIVVHGDNYKHNRIKN